MKRDAVIDVFRAIACLWVVAHHSTVPSLAPLLLKNFIYIGWLGVNLFFIISGFLIFGLLTRPTTSKNSYLLFYIRRAFKIFPQYVCLLLFIFLFCIMGVVDVPTGTPYWSYFLFIQNYFPFIFPLAHTWSLCVEEWFYFSLPILLLLSNTLKNKVTSLSLRQIQILILLLPIVLSDIAKYLYFSPGMSADIAPMTQFNIGSIYYGCLFYCLFDLKAFTTRWINFLAWIFTIALAAYCYSINQGTPAITWYSSDLVQICFGMILLLCCTSPLIHQLCEKLPRLLTIGRCSYGIYIWHLPVVLCRRSLFGSFTSPLSEWILFSTCLLLSIAIGYFTTQWVEQYFLQIRDKYFHYETKPVQWTEASQDTVFEYPLSLKEPG